jgi:regulatory protein SWI6
VAMFYFKIPPPLLFLFHAMPEKQSAQVYSAVYSGVPVYEMMCGDIPVMRRVSDGYMNATQILKIAGFSKPKRTKILEREVLCGVHEKIQGGYGKYQGTWSFRANIGSR